MRLRKIKLIQLFPIDCSKIAAIIKVIYSF
jgi:hypothetical protein